MRRLIHINFNHIIFRLLCWYAFLIPFEKILEVLFSIETVFKPYRILALLILLTFSIKTLYKWDENRQLKTDIFLYAIFIYGLVVTAIRMVTTSFSMSLFYNDIFQMGLYLALFFVIRHTQLSIKNLFTISRYLCYGIFINAVYIFYNFHILKNYARESGFMDNPNYLAFSIVIFILFAITRKSQLVSFYDKIAWWLILVFISYIFIISGSRAGAAVLLMSAIAFFFISNWKEKRMVIVFTFCVGLMIAGRQIYSNNVGPLILLNRILNKETSDDPRIKIWTGIINASQETYFVGLGIGQFKHNFRKYYFEENHYLIKRIISRGYFLSPHSDYFALLIIYGIVGLISYLIFLYLSASNLLYKIKTTIDSQTKTYYQYSISILTALVVFGLAAESFNSPIFWLILSVSTKKHFEQL